MLVCWGFFGAFFGRFLCPYPENGELGVNRGNFAGKQINPCQTLEIDSSPNFAIDVALACQTHG